MEAIGYHGTTRQAACDIFKNGIRDKGYRGPHWLGRGLYFFQDAPLRAARWARFKSEIRDGDPPLVLKVMIKTDQVIDFLDVEHWPLFKQIIEKSIYNPTPQIGPEFLFKDRSILEQHLLYKNYEDDNYVTELASYYEREKPVMAVRAAFVEGSPVHRTSWLLDEAHVQICVRNDDAIQEMDWFEITTDDEYRILSDKDIEGFCNTHQASPNI